MMALYMRRALGILFLIGGCCWYAFMLVWLCGAKSSEALPNPDFLTLSCIEASPYKSQDNCIKQVSQTKTILTKEKL